MIGAQSAPHRIEQGVMKVDDPASPLMKPFAGNELRTATSVPTTSTRSRGFRTYGKGRVFYNSLGHMPETFMTPEIVGHFLAGLQFLLGDLAADTTPNPASRGSGQ